jgi:hypothetical protein
MRNLILSALILASAFQTALGEQYGDWTYSVENNRATINRYTGVAGAVTIPSEVNGIPVVSVGNEGWASIVGPYGNNTITSLNIPMGVTEILPYAFWGLFGLNSVIIPSSVMSIGENAFQRCSSLTSVTMPDRFLAQISQLGIGGQVATDYLVTALANNDAFVTAVANKILAKSGNYGLSVKSELGTLATKSELTSALTESRTAGVNSVLSNPNLWTLYTTSQIQNMAVGDLVLTKNVGGTFTLNYDIEQSTDLQTWTPYQALSLPLTGLPTDKAFVRIKAKQ